MAIQDRCHTEMVLGRRAASPCRRPRRPEAAGHLPRSDDRSAEAIEPQKAYGQVCSALQVQVGEHLPERRRHLEAVPRESTDYSHFGRLAAGRR